MNKYKKVRKLCNSNEGVAGAIVALLMVGLIISSISFIQLNYVPQWTKDKESEQLDEVSKQFAQIKYSIDTLSAAAKTGGRISSPITLGTNEIGIPFLSSSTGYGNLEILSDEFQMQICYNTDASGTCDLSQIYKIGAIKYTSINTRYINQIYTFEAGAVILSQDEGEIVQIKPSFKIIKSSDDLSFEITQIKETGGKPTATGYGTYPLQIEFSNARPQIKYMSVSKITIMSSNIKAWFNYFKNELLSNYVYIESILPLEEDEGSIVIQINFKDLDSDPTVVDLPNVYLDITDINVQLAPGWVE